MSTRKRTPGCPGLSARANSYCRRASAIVAAAEEIVTDFDGHEERAIADQRRPIDDHDRRRRRAGRDDTESIEIGDDHGAKYRRPRREHHDRRGRSSRRRRFLQGRGHRRRGRYLGGRWRRGHGLGLLRQLRLVVSLLLVRQLEHAAQGWQTVGHLLWSSGDDACGLHNQTGLGVHEPGIDVNAAQLADAAKQHVACIGQLAELAATRVVDAKVVGVEFHFR